ncbi:orotidine-5'-phosphate decarboxylase [Sinobacterium caligoides]|uniref:Orotidine 5'-phosphate decarboxylase n=1 Tax=Sinobacterium caligoides TaxID=933926 RepID=A0A3N2DZC7_9GAMM|nr:orotidine-5'-phosphate decarboxylase [Sinobacterium caligoides]ROS05127.1 orotidine-5'-phosphate decarboxylase [Sinobacterium caligoides]
MSDPKILVALDFPTADGAIAMADQLSADSCRLKVGKELFTAAGPQLVESLVKRGFDVFLDLKFHDIPNTCAGAVRSAAELGVWMVNVHASGGRRMMEAAREAIDKSAHQPLLIAVTVLTSMEAEDLAEVGIAVAPQEQVKRLALLTESCGLDGVVCSAQEAPMLRSVVGGDFKLVTPGIRPLGDAAGDQRRIVTPAQALRDGSDYLVIGRPITSKPKPLDALQSILADIKAGD